ncbi:hypothetical protein predicted by Glimmer/Critica [Lactiplantibacillus plantarum]|nr:hypothetical protein predicted by Glimmer/Critica [Lactiplantibacillus plantarum]
MPFYQLSLTDGLTWLPMTVAIIKGWMHQIL